jgi:hypothetical protein
MVTWKGSQEFNLDAHTFEYDSPADALSAGWQLGEGFEQDAHDMSPLGKFGRYRTSSG